MCKGYAAPPVDRDGQHAKRVMDKLNKIEGALDDSDTGYAVCQLLTCRRAAVVK